MSTEEHYRRIGDLQERLHEARRRGDAELEVATLLEIGRAAYAADDLGLANMHFDLAAKVIRRSGRGLARLHEALAERALVFRNARRLQEALDLYRQAAEAAREYAGPLEYANCVGKQGLLHRLMGNADLARQAFQEARDIFVEQGGAGLAGLADQEGYLGLLASDAGDFDAAEDAYRLALDLAMHTGSRDMVRTWATNLGNALSRRRRYQEAWGCYRQAMKAARSTGNEHAMRSAAQEWATSYRNAHRPLKSAGVLIAAAGRVTRPEVRCQLLEDALGDLLAAGAWQRLVQVGSEVARLLEDQGAEQQRLERCNQLVDYARKGLGRRKPIRLPASQGVLDLFLAERMEQYTNSRNIWGMRDMAHLLCDIGLGLMDTSERAWKPFVSESWLRFRVLGDAVKALCEAEMPAYSLEVSQRAKSLGFCLPNIRRLQQAGPPHQEAADYLERLEALSIAVASLARATLDNVPQRVEAVRAAGEALMEAGEALRDRDPVLHARLGGIVHPDGLMDALPVADPVGIIDLVVTREGTVVHILRRLAGRVHVAGGLISEFTAQNALELLEAWAKGNVAGEISQRQWEALVQISTTLHGLLCPLAKHLNDSRVPQVILVPDIATRHLPVHLGFICSREVQDIVKAINIAGMALDGEQVLFSEVFPVEYAPCLQAVAVSQHQRRPQEIRHVLSLADAGADLPGARNTAGWLASRLPETLTYSSYVGEKATVTNLYGEMDRADVIVIGTHGDFDPAQPEQSALEFQDGPWTLSAMLEGPAFSKGPVMVLSACEVGAMAPTPDDLAASGIPGALISAGAASVLAGLWPVEDISMGYVVERFITHLSHRGYRPAAALFRAVRDLRLLLKEDALQRCYSLLEQMESDGTAESLPEQYLLLNNLVERIEDSQAEHPFASPQFWGSIVVVGSGWHRPAGAVVGPAEDIPHLIEDRLKREEARALMAQGRFREARKLLEEVLPLADGADRAQTLHALAWAVWGSRPSGADRWARWKASRLLAQAGLIARSERDERLVSDIEDARQALAL